MNSEFYNLADFLKGNTSLNAIELNLLGNLEGKTILHLQCHFGQDTIALSRLGGKVTGIDLLGKCAEWNNSVGFGHVIRRCNSLLEYYGDDEKNHKIIFPGQENLLY